MTKLGTNLDSCKDYSANFAFADCMRMARAWGTAATPYDGKAVLDSNGFPVGDFGTVVMTGVAPTTGIYKLSFTGQADVSPSASNASVLNKVYDQSKNLTTADIQVNADSQLFLSFKNVRGLSNPKLIRPGCKDTDLFDPRFIANLKDFRVLRFMDWLHTNNSPIKTWADRKRPDEILQSGDRGVALEYCIELCNQVGADMWVNIPHMADDDYVTKAAQLIKANLKPELVVYVEYSNEVWNTIFSQTGWNYTQAQADVAAGQKDLSLDGTDANTYYWGRRRVAKRIMQIGRIFKNIFGESSSSGRVRPVLASQIADPSVGRAELGYLAKYAPSVPGEIYGVAGAPYFATNEHLQKDVNGKVIKDANNIELLRADASVQMIIDGLHNSVTTNISRWKQEVWDGVSSDPIKSKLSNLAKYYGVKFLFYEMGSSLVSGVNTTRQQLERAAQLDTQMYQIVLDYLNGMQTQGVDLACYFVSIGGWGDGRYGYWGAKERYDVETPKSKALHDVAKALNGPSIDDLKAQILQLQSQIIALADENMALKAQLRLLQDKIDQIKAIAAQ